MHRYGSSALSVDGDRMRTCGNTIELGLTIAWVWGILRVAIVVLDEQIRDVREPAVEGDGRNAQCLVSSNRAVVADAISFDAIDAAPVIVLAPARGAESGRAGRFLGAAGVTSRGTGEWRW